MVDSITAVKSAGLVLQTSDNLGAMEIGTFVGLILYGVTLAQGYVYFAKYKSDPVYMRAMVAFLMFLETLYTFFTAYAIYLDTVTDWAKAQLNSYPISITALLESMIIVMVQTFFVYRIHRITRRVVLPFFLFLLVLARFGTSMAITVLALLDVPKRPNGLIFHDDRALITAVLASGAATDLLIAVALSYDLRKMVTELTAARTTKALNRLIRWSLQTGIITSLMSIAQLVCFQAMSNMVWLGLYIVLAKLYSVSLLIALNVRQLNHANSTAVSKDEASINSSTTHVQRDPKVYNLSETFPVVQLHIL